MAETDIRESVAAEMEDLLRDMQAGYKVVPVLPLPLLSGSSPAEAVLAFVESTDEPSTWLCFGDSRGQE